MICDEINISTVSSCAFTLYCRRSLSKSLIKGEPNRKTTRANDDDEFIFYLSTIVDVFVVVVLNGLVPPPDDCHLSPVVGSYHPDHQIVPDSS